MIATFVTRLDKLFQGLPATRENEKGSMICAQPGNCQEDGMGNKKRKDTRPALTVDTIKRMAQEMIRDYNKKTEDFH